MSDTTLNASPQDTPRSGPSGLARFFASVALLRESRVGMIGAGLVLIWVFMALLATLNSLLVDAGVLQLGIVFPPNATFAPIMPPFSAIALTVSSVVLRPLALRPSALEWVQTGAFAMAVVSARVR